jgi:NIMA (never in mitosis gene a)-related kinase
MKADMKAGQAPEQPAHKDAAAAPDEAAVQAAAAVVPACPGRLREAYDVQKPVGKGGYAVVHKGVRRQDGRIVAVKKVEVSVRDEQRHT